jgi:adenylate cyclase
VVCGEYYFNASARAEKDIRDRKKHVDFVLDFSGNMIIKDNLDLLTERLKQARESRMIDFYILQKKNKLITFYNKQNNPDDLKFEFADTSNEYVESEDIAFKSFKIYDFTMTAGIVTGKKRIVRALLGEQKYFILNDLLVGTILFAFLVVALIRGQINLRAFGKSKSAEAMGEIKVISREKNPESQPRNRKRFISPAILHELDNKENAPPTFESTVVRVCLSSHTQTALAKKDEHLTNILNKYFVAARELIERYNGLVYQYVGSEIVFHMKGPKNLTEPMALSCIRSLFELAEEIEKTLPIEAGSHFKLKASFSSGELCFVKLDTGYSITGLPLTEAMKFLSSADNKFNNTLAIHESGYDRVSRLCKVSEANQDGVCMVTEFAPQRLIFEKDKAEYCTYYRSDLDLMALMSYMENLVKEQRDDLFFRIFGDMKTLKTHIICNELERAFTHFLEMTYRQSHDKAVNPKILSAAVSMTQHLIPPGRGSEKLTEILKLYLQFQDPRVQANAVSVLGEVASNVFFLRKFIHSDHNRLSADALVVAGKQVVDKELVSQVQKLLRSSDKVYQASGRYVALKLVEHYKQHDAVYYNTNPHLKKLEDLLGKAA